MNCPQCTSTNITTQTVTEWIPFGNIEQAYQATFPAMTCNDCTFGWRDFRAEEAIEEALGEYLAVGEVQSENSVAEFSTKVRELLAEYIGDSAGVREAYREALLLLAAEL